MEHRQEAHKHCPQCHTSLMASREGASLSFCQSCGFPLMLVAGKYRLMERLGEGSTATIYLAHHIALAEEKERVVKVIKPEVLQDETSRYRFQREIQVTIALGRRNQHVVTIYDDFGEDTRLGYYYVMEYLQGNVLQDIMYHGEPLGNWLAFRVMYQLCDAVAAAHRAGIVHRDLKPENMLLVERDTEPYFLKLIDFGIAKSMRRKLDLVVTHGALGTPAYMSPEQCLNKPVDGRSDIYSMGALMYELLTGFQLFQDPQEEHSEEPDREGMLALLEAQVNKKPKPMRELCPKLNIPEGLDQAVRQALEKDPNRRYQRVEDFWNALAPFAPSAYQQLSMGSQAMLPSVRLSPPSSVNLPTAPPDSDWNSPGSQEEVAKSEEEGISARIARFISTQRQPMTPADREVAEARSYDNLPAQRQPVAQPRNGRVEDKHTNPKTSRRSFVPPVDSRQLLPDALQGPAVGDPSQKPIDTTRPPRPATLPPRMKRTAPMNLISEESSEDDELYLSQPQEELTPSAAAKAKAIAEAQRSETQVSNSPSSPSSSGLRPPQMKNKLAKTMRMRMVEDDDDSEIIQPQKPSPSRPSKAIAAAISKKVDSATQLPALGGLVPKAPPVSTQNTTGTKGSDARLPASPFAKSAGSVQHTDTRVFFEDAVIQDAVIEDADAALMFGLEKQKSVPTTSRTHKHQMFLPQEEDYATVAAYHSPSLKKDDTGAISILFEDEPAPTIQEDDDDEFGFDDLSTVAVDSGDFGKTLPTDGVSLEALQAPLRPQQASSAKRVSSSQVPGGGQVIDDQAQTSELTPSKVPWFKPPK